MNRSHLALYSFIFYFLFINICIAQPDNDLPLPILKGVKKVVVLYYPLETANASQQSAGDTDKIFLLNAEGMVTVEYGYSFQTRIVKNTYEYEKGNLIKRSKGGKTK